MQRVGASTLAVSLPSEWTKNVGLKKGDLIFFKEEDGALKLMTVRQIEKPVRTVEINADLCMDPKMLGRVLMGIYSLGHDVVKVVSANRLKIEQVDKVRGITRELMGIGIMEETRNHIMIQCSIDITKFPIHTLLRRFYIIGSTMHREVIDALSEFDVSLAEEAIRRKKEAETIFWVIIRLLNSCQKDKIIAKKLKIENPIQILWYRLITQRLRYMVEWAAKTAENVVALRKHRGVIGEHLLNEMIKINERSYGVCHEAINSFFSSDVDLANQAIGTYNEIQKTEEQLQEAVCNQVYLHGKSFSVSKYFKDKKPIDPCMIVQISFVIWGARRIAELGSQMAEIGIHKLLCEHTKLCKEHSISG